MLFKACGESSAAQSQAAKSVIKVQEMGFINMQQVVEKEMGLSSS
jgi:hypothetical protein